MIKNKNLVYSGLCIAVFALLAVIYAYPVISGKALIQPDIVHYRGGAKELLDYRASQGEETYWSDSMFGGMPTYQIGAQFRGDVIKQIDYALNFLPKPANYLFLLLAGFFLLGMVVVRNWRYALLGATFFGLSTYFYIIIAAGHNGKVHTVAYFAPLLAGILLVYIRRKYLLGFVTTTLFMGLQIAANHPQMTYYLFLALAFLFLSELYRAFKSKTDWKHFGLSSGILAVAFVLGIGMNSQRILANSEYVKETTRGKQILNENGQKSGLDRESITAWSYGKLETLNLFIPRLMGGGSDEPEAEKMMEQVQQMVQDNVQSQQEMDAISKGFNSLTYWGDQPMTSGPAYQGAVVVFLAILGFFFAENKYRYWVLGASILTILLAWGHHFAPLTDFFIDVVPFYNKFRAPSSILVIVELLFPFIAILGLYQFYQSDKIAKEQKTKTLLYVSASVLGITLLLLVFGKGLLGFYTDTEKQYLPPYLLDFLVGERYKMFQEDAIKAVVYVAITAGVLLASLKGKLHQNIALLVIGLVSLLDLWSVNQRYLNSSNFVDKTFAENPFITENSDYLADKASQNTYIAGLLSQTEINKTLQEIADKDKAHYRIYNQALGAFNETNTSYFKSSIGGYSAAKLRRYDDIINHYFYNNMDSVKTPKVLNMLNAKYMIFGGSEGVQEVPNPSANGNAWLVSDVKWVQTPNEEIRAIGEVDTKKTAVILKKEFEKEMKNAKFSADSTATIDLKTYQPNELVYQSQSQTPQLAVFSEIYYPYGWKIFIDGTEQPLIRANYLLRSAIIPAGKHEIKMIFQPEVIEKGKLYSLLSFGLFLILSGLGFFLVRKKEQNG